MVVCGGMVGLWWFVVVCDVLWCLCMCVCCGALWCSCVCVCCDGFLRSFAELCAGACCGAHKTLCPIVETRRAMSEDRGDDNAGEDYTTILIFLII